MAHGNVTVIALEHAACMQRMGERFFKEGRCEGHRKCVPYPGLRREDPGERDFTILCKMQVVIRPLGSHFEPCFHPELRDSSQSELFLGLRKCPFIRLSSVYLVIRLLRFWLSDRQQGIFKIEHLSSSRMWLLWKQP